MRKEIESEIFKTFDVEAVVNSGKGFTIINIGGDDVLIFKELSEVSFYYLPPCNPPLSLKKLNDFIQANAQLITRCMIKHRDDNLMAEGCVKPQMKDLK